MNQSRIIADVKQSVKNNANVDLAVKSVMGAAFVGVAYYGLLKLSKATGIRPIKTAADVIKGAK